ncbi:hypothetical protein B4U80_12837 [Leptotrombidium deliense]|uniref:F-box domain-containing protein n=1 Tax=Leptotrombidium deliense TaxID=299467 RepID=A0A443SJX8_9ACAR|nr:hypothetical protein B4U80_12837 [Leptotrombidium deliense]
MMTAFEELPDGVLLDILSRLSTKQVSRVGLLCRRLYVICKDELKRRSSLIVTSRNPEENFESLNGDCNAFMFGSDSINASFPQTLHLLRISLVNIRYLRLHYCDGINDENVFFVGKYLPNLKKLWISDMGLTDEGLSILFTHCDVLETLILGAFQMNGSCFKYLPPLKNFTIEHFEFDSQCFELLSKRLTNTLEKFSFYFYFHKHYESFNDWILEKFLNHFPKLKTFKWYCNPTLFDYRTIDGEIAYPSFYFFLSTINEIEELALSYCPTLPLQQLRHLPKFYSLKSLSVGFYNDTSDDCFAELVSKFPNLERLHFSASRLDTFVKSIDAIKHLHSLRELSLQYQGFQQELQLLFDCKSLRKLKITGFDNKQFIDFIDFAKNNERSDAPLEVELIMQIKERIEGFENETVKLKVQTSNTVEACRSVDSNWSWVDSAIIVD